LNYSDGLHREFRSAPAFPRGPRLLHRVVADMFLGREPSASEYRRKQGPARPVGRRCTARVCRRYSRWCSGPQVSDIAYHASPIPRLWPCSSSEGRTPRKETGSVFGAFGCCSTSTAVRCELSRLRLLESLLHIIRVNLGVVLGSGNRHIGEAVVNQEFAFLCVHVD
jgi:hypothetical protein